MLYIYNIDIFFTQTYTYIYICIIIYSTSESCSHGMWKGFSSLHVWLRSTDSPQSSRPGLSAKLLPRASKTGHAGWVTGPEINRNDTWTLSASQPPKRHGLGGWKNHTPLARGINHWIHFTSIGQFNRIQHDSRVSRLLFQNLAL